MVGHLQQTLLYSLIFLCDSISELKEVKSYKPITETEFHTGFQEHGSRRDQEKKMYLGNSKD